MVRRRWRAASLVICSLAGCAPELNWREAAVGDDLRMMFPCRPATQARSVPLAGTRSAVDLWACDAAGSSWALLLAEVDDPGRVPTAMAELVATAHANVGATPGAAGPTTELSGARLLGAARYRAAGRRPDGSPTQLDMIVFARDSKVYRASVSGGRPTEDAVEAFFSSIKGRN